jgi:hypothetical protein
MATVFKFIFARLFVGVCFHRKTIDADYNENFTEEKAQKEAEDIAKSRIPSEVTGHPSFRCVWSTKPKVRNAKYTSETTPNAIGGKWGLKPLAQEDVPKVSLAVHQGFLTEDRPKDKKYAAWFEPGGFTSPCPPGMSICCTDDLESIYKAMISNYNPWARSWSYTPDPISGSLVPWKEKDQKTAPVNIEFEYTWEAEKLTSESPNRPGYVSDGGSGYTKCEKPTPEESDWTKVKQRSKTEMSYLQSEKQYDSRISINCQCSCGPIRFPAYCTTKAPAPTPAPGGIRIYYPPQQVQTAVNYLAIGACVAAGLFLLRGSFLAGCAAGSIGMGILSEARACAKPPNYTFTNRAPKAIRPTKNPTPPY